MRARICLAVALSLLFMSAERAVDLLAAGPAHAVQHVHESGSGPSGDDPGHGEEACGHCLHGHCASIVMQACAFAPACASAGAPGSPAVLHGLLGAPPTRPPNA